MEELIANTDLNLIIERLESEYICLKTFYIKFAKRIDRDLKQEDMMESIPDEYYIILESSYFFLTCEAFSALGCASPKLLHRIDIKYFSEYFDALYRNKYMDEIAFFDKYYQYLSHFYPDNKEFKDKHDFYNREFHYSDINNTIHKELSYNQMKWKMDCIMNFFILNYKYDPPVNNEGLYFDDWSIKNILLKPY